ncbi:prolyl oligopeptidase family serine peptidase [Halobaculum sp. WSA2]|uniref:Prolyl oligopeptidase family serine peptidase n=1 Tax=Halobaculum saliterrae TaxID=2073113 RepID=A0A6B0SYL0_9EURY|nr:S9 family peptidase [Halobaculum saliterrae]MXR41060.1 prolyl oligopeptidase family serine peptidase [Halobaculum saliterrae]
MQHGVDIESYYDLRLLAEVSVSPDGERVAFTAEESDPAADEHRTGLYVAPTDGSRDPHRLTRASTASSPTWGPDGVTLAFLAARDTDLDRRRGRADEADGEPDETDADEDAERDGNGGNGSNGENSDGKPQVWAFDLARGGDARQLTAFEHGIKEFDLAPDGDRLVVAARDPTEEEEGYLEQREDGGPIEVTRLQHKRDGAGWLDDVTTYLFVGGLDAEDADAESFDRLDDAYGAGSSEPLAGLQPAWGPTGRIAFTTCVDDDPDDSGAYDVCTIAPDGSDRRVVTDGSLRCGSPTWSPDGDRLAFDGSNYDNWYEPNEAYVAPDEAGAAFESVSAELDRTLARSGAPRWLDGETVVVPIADEAWTRLAVCPVDGEPRRAFTRQGRDRTIAAFDLAGDTVALGLTGADQPPDVYAVPGAELREDDAGGPTRRLSTLNDEWLDERAEGLPDCGVVAYENGDGEEIEAVVYYPSDFDVDADEPAPTICSIHGGPMSYDAPGFRFDVAYWTSRGYVVAKPNYRGSTSYGRAFSESLKGTRGELESDDVISAMEHLVDEGVADPDRLFCTGFSYGGITTAHVVTRTDMFAAAAPEHGVYDFYSNFGTDDNHNWHQWEFGMPWENEALYRDISSITRVGDIDTPLLITAGEEDWRCPPTQAEQLYVSVRKQGIDAKLVIYPDEHHNIGTPERATHRIEELTEWFETHDPGVAEGASGASD